MTVKAGMNRFVWDMRYPGPDGDSEDDHVGAGTRGPKAVPGRYQVRLTVAGGAAVNGRLDAGFAIRPHPLLPNVTAPTTRRSSSSPCRCATA